MMKFALSLTAAGVLVIAVFGAFGLTMPVAAQTDGPKLLSSLRSGEWMIKYRDGSPEQKICLRTGSEIIQLRHSGSDCTRFVVENGASQVTVQYTCPGNGYGRTNIRKESASLIQIESQGIESGLPFQFTAEARRTGSCIP